MTATGAALETNADCELIADNVHSHPGAHRLVWRMKRGRHIVLITDSMRAAGLGDGESELGGQKVFVRDGIARLAGGTIAGSVLTMDRAVWNFAENTGCGIPAIMACRTIRDERERRATSMLATFIPCGAKIPVIALFAGAFFNGAGWVSTLSYFFGLVLIFLGALLIKGITGYKYRKSFFIMELPKFKLPSLKFAFKSMMERAKAYIIKAATIILVCNTVVQIMQTFNWHFQVVEEGMENTSILASIASPFAILLIPLGFGVWQLAAAAITGFIAKENVVGTLAVVYGLTAFIDVDELELMGGANEVAMAMGLTSVTALAYLFFNLYTPPCFAAIGAMNSEMKSKGWLWGAIGLQLGTGYTVAFLIYQIGTLITEGHLGNAFVPGLIAVLCMAAAVILIGKRIRSHFDEQYRLHQTAAQSAK